MCDNNYKEGIIKPTKENYEEYLRIDGEEERYVAMLDIMGFKHMVETMPSNDIYELLCNADAIKQVLEKNTGPLWISVFSDTIIIVTKGVEERRDLFSLILSSAMIQRKFFDNGYALNGGISRGKVTVDKERNIIFGQPVIDAHLLQEKIFYYGIAFDKKLNNTFDSLNFEDIVPSVKCPIVKECIPVKTGNKFFRKTKWEEHYHLSIRNLWTLAKLKDWFTMKPIDVDSSIKNCFSEIENYCNNRKSKKYLEHTKKILKI